MTTRIAQLTDLHLYGDPDGRLGGVPTQATFRDVLGDLQARADPPDYLVLTGDLAHDEAPGTYAWLREMLAPWAGRYRLVPGNHDDRQAMRAVFPELFAGGVDGGSSGSTRWCRARWAAGSPLASSSGWPASSRAIQPSRR